MWCVLCQQILLASSPVECHLHVCMHVPECCFLYSYVMCVAHEGRQAYWTVSLQWLTVAPTAFPLWCTAEFRHWFIDGWVNSESKSVNSGTTIVFAEGVFSVVILVMLNNEQNHSCWFLVVSYTKGTLAEADVPSRFINHVHHKLCCKDGSTNPSISCAWKRVLHVCFVNIDRSFCISIVKSCKTHFGEIFPDYWCSFGKIARPTCFCSECNRLTFQWLE